MEQESVAGIGFDRRAIPAEAREELWTAADGHAIRRIDWGGVADGARGSLLFLPGRGDFYEKYLETLHYWHSLGWRVTALDWRGQGSSGLFGNNGEAEPEDAFAVWIDDLAHFWRTWSAQNAAPHVIVAHSMGGHIALRAMAAGLVKPDAAVLCAPMLGLQPQYIPRGVLYGVARRVARLRQLNQSIPKGQASLLGAGINRFDRLTHDADRYADEAWWRQERPQHGFSPPTWPWIEQALASMGELERPGVLEGMDVPTLILAAPRDKLVSWKAIRETAARLPCCHLVSLGEDARHELLREADYIRDRVIAAIDGFLDVSAPAEGPRL